MQLSLVNYQAWERASLQVEGLTVVVGPSNRGKSSFGRAVRGVLRNEVLPTHIKLGTPGTEVGVRYKDLDIRVTRGSKTKDTSVYFVGDQKFEKLGGDIPAAVKDLSFGPVEVHGVKLDPCFAGQFDGQFLVGSSPAELNAVLNAFASTERLDRGRKALAKQVNEADATAKALTPQISRLEEEEARIAALLEAAEPVTAQHAPLLAQAQRLERAIAAVERLQAAAKRHQELQAHLSVTQRLATRLEATLTTWKRLLRADTATRAGHAAKASASQLTKLTQKFFN